MLLQKNRSFRDFCPLCLLLNAHPSMLLAFTESTGMHTVTSTKTPSLGLRSWGTANSQHQFLNPRRSMHTSLYDATGTVWPHLATHTDNVSSLCAILVTSKHLDGKWAWTILQRSLKVKNSPVMFFKVTLCLMGLSLTKYLAVLFIQWLSFHAQYSWTSLEHGNII